MFYSVPGVLVPTDINITMCSCPCICVVDLVFQPFANESSVFPSIHNCCLIYLPLHLTMQAGGDCRRSQILIKHIFTIGPGAKLSNRNLQCIYYH